jgi:hypothetical protein
VQLYILVSYGVVYDIHHLLVNVIENVCILLYIFIRQYTLNYGTTLQHHDVYVHTNFTVTD